jgi:L-lysine 2,3-aminomutase
VSDDFEAPREDRRRVPDVFSYRLGAVEQLSQRNGEELSKLERIVHELVASMPARFPSRIEHDKLAESLASLTTHLETYVATANASNAIRESNRVEKQTIRLQWPAWVLLGITTVCTVLALVLH